MTRAEAKEIIGAMSWEIYTQEVSDEKKLEALNMAIEALSENKRTDKHTETHACDCISRQAAIDANLAEAKRRGMTYSEWQVEQTLQRVRRGEL